MSKNIIISFQHLTFIRQAETILHNISGHFQESSITALIGPSGSGKTTLLKTLNGLLSPTSALLPFLINELKTTTRLNFARLSVLHYKMHRLYVERYLKI